MTTAQEIKAHVENDGKVAEALVTLWNSLITLPIPIEQFRVWLSQFEVPTVVYGIKETGAKFQRVRGNMDEDYLLRFASKVMKNRYDRKSNNPTTH